ncbi:hypothetical protein ACFQHO_03510 [Actinomadura yumaensis]|uniref:hypothetical protein n=1 Tax=Actinomadura yumaensis TaxID=111807 RepID=UPI003623A659
MRERRPRRWSVRTKAALGAMAAAAVAFGLGVFWARESIGARWADEAERRATQDAFQVVSALEAGRQPIGFDSPFVVVLADGRLGGGMDAASGPSPERAWPGFAPTVGWGTRRLRPPAAEEASGPSGRSLSGPPTSCRPNGSAGSPAWTTCGRPSGSPSTRSPRLGAPRRPSPRSTACSAWDSRSRWRSSA